jgi:small-conductance mechanosensitive channel
MSFLDQVYFSNRVETWLLALAVTAIIFIVLKIVQRVSIKNLSRLAGKTETKIDDLLVGVLSKTKILFLIIVSIYFGSSTLILHPAISRFWQKIVIMTVIIQVTFWVGAGIAFWLTNAVKKRMEEDAASATTISVLGFISKLILWSIALLLMMDNIGINITSLVAGLGIGGIAVALSVQNILGDLFASLSIVIDKPFVIGDSIVVDQLSGIVEHIGMKTTRVRSVGGEQLIFSNNDLLKSRIGNYRRMTERRIVFIFGVIYHTPPEKLVLINTIIKEIVEAQHPVRFDRVHFKEYGESSLNFEVVYFVKNPDYNLYMDIQQAINLEIFRRFLSEGIEFAYPTRTMFIQSGAGQSPDSRTIKSQE